MYKGQAIDRSSSKIDRAQDYTPSIDTLAQKKIETSLKLPGDSLVIGEAAKFLDCIKTEIIPFIDKSYKTNSDRGIAGHSLGGLFTACLLFSSYAAADLCGVVLGRLRPIVYNKPKQIGLNT